MIYLNCKKVGRTQDAGHVKPKSLKAVTEDQWLDMLKAIEDSEPENTNWVRDYALIFLGAALGMRVGEIVLFERRHFADLEKYDVIHIPTLKQSEKIQFVCPGKTSNGEVCRRKSRVKLSSAGKPHRCYCCGTTSDVPVVHGVAEHAGVVEIDVDIVEEKTVMFILDYLEHMRPDQNLLFEGRKHKPLSRGHANAIFNTFLVRAGIDPRVSFHSLRHNRGVRVYSMFKDLVLCKNALRHKNVATTQIYADLDQEQKERYRDELNKKAFDPLKKRRSKQN